MPDRSTQYYVTMGPFNGAHYAAYHRLDFKINRHFNTSHGRISAYVALINVYNRGNERNIDYNWRWISRARRPYLFEQKEYWFKLLPSIGVSWSWNH